MISEGLIKQELVPVVLFSFSGIGSAFAFRGVSYGYERIFFC